MKPASTFAISVLAEVAERSEFVRLEKDLRDLWEGCVPWHEAIQMIGAADHPARDELRRSWARWQRRLAGR